MVQIDRIKDIAQRCIEGPELYLVDIQLTGNPANQNLSVTLDSDEGVTIDECAEVSRKLGEELEEAEVFEGKYQLVVSSPGIDQPLTLKRQYLKNIGRDLKVILISQKEVSGKLNKVSEDEILIQEFNNGKNKSIKYSKKEVPISFDDIYKANIIISFK